MTPRQIDRILNWTGIEESKRDEVRSILERVKIIDKGCWTVREDWSDYVPYKKSMLHRFMFSIFNGNLRTGRMICHKCDRPGCINPEHLFQGTSSENYQDAVNKKRAPKTVLMSNKRFHAPKIKELRKLRERDNWKQLVRFCGE